MERLVILVLATTLCQQSAGKSLPTFAGPYIVAVQRMYVCDEAAPFQWNVRMSHFNPSKPRVLQRYTGNVTAGPPGMNDDMWVRAVLDSRSNNQWKENAFIFHFPNKGCSTIFDMMAGPASPQQVFLNLTSVSKKNCVVRPGVTTFTNEPVNYNFTHIPVMPYGQYRVRFMAGYGKNKYGCLVVEGVCAPRV